MNPGRLKIKENGVWRYAGYGLGGTEGDKNYTESFTNQSQVTLTHNLGKYPAISVIDSAGDEVVGNVEYLDVNTVRISFVGSFTGIATCN